MKQNRALGINIVRLIFLTLVLKCIGFINRIVIAYFYGATAATDIYYNVSGFVDSIASILLAGLSIGIINVYISNVDGCDKKTFISNVETIVVLIMMGIMVGCIIFSNQVSHVLAVNYSDKQYEQMSLLIKILVIALPLQGLVTIFGAVLQAQNIFIPVRLTGTFSSIISIICVMLLNKRLGIYALVASFILGYLFNALFLRFHVGLSHKYSIHKFYKDANIRKLLILVFPLILGMAGHEVNLIIDKSVASRLAEGAVSALSYSCVLYLLIENTIINSIVTVLFPNIAEDIKNGKDSKLGRNVKSIIVFAEALLIPIVIFSYFNAENITRIVYYRGSFDLNSLSLTSCALQGYVVGLPFLAIRDIAMRVYYAYGDTKAPVMINLLSVIINIFLDFILYKPLGVLGITLSTSISNAIAGMIMILYVRHYNGWILDKSLIRELTLIVLAGFVSTAFIWVIKGQCSMFFEMLINLMAVVGIEFIAMLIGRSYVLKQLFKVLRIRVGR